MSTFIVSDSIKERFNPDDLLENRSEDLESPFCMSMCINGSYYEITSLEYGELINDITVDLLIDENNALGLFKNLPGEISLYGSQLFKFKDLHLVELKKESNTMVKAKIYITNPETLI